MVMGWTSECDEKCRAGIRAIRVIVLWKIYVEIILFEHEMLGY